MRNLKEEMTTTVEMYYLNQAEAALRTGDEQGCVNWFFEGVKNEFSEEEKAEFQKLISAII